MRKSRIGVHQIHKFKSGNSKSGTSALVAIAHGPHWWRAFKTKPEGPRKAYFCFLKYPELGLGNSIGINRFLQENKSNSHSHFLSANRIAESSTPPRRYRRSKFELLDPLGKGAQTSNNARIFTKIQFYNSKSATLLHPSMTSSRPRPDLSL